jgi:hypothetical protein
MTFGRPRDLLPTFLLTKMCITADRSRALQAIVQANAERRLLLTEDKDFGELVVRWRRPVPGLIRIDSELHALKWSRLDTAIQKFGDGLFDRYTVIDEMRFRSRSLIGPR